MNLITAREILDGAYIETGITQEEAAKMVGMTGKQLCDRLDRGTMRAELLNKILDHMGIDSTYIIRATGKPLRLRRQGYGKPITKMVDRTVYNTAKSFPLANSFFEDGEHEYRDGHATELYQSKEGEYFLVEYYSFDGAKPNVVPLTKDEAEAYVDRYGNELFRNKRE